MRIDSKSSSSRVGAGNKARNARKSSGNFQGRLGRVDSVVSTASVVASADSVSGVDALLAVQQVDELPHDSERDWAKHWGGDILSRLSQLRDGLLSGNIPIERLERLSEALTERRAVTDPDLASVMDQIELRAKIEIAKLNRDFGQRNR